MNDLNVSMTIRAVDQASPVLSRLAGRLQTAQIAAARLGSSSGFGLVAAAAGQVGDRLQGVMRATAQVSQRIGLMTAGLGFGFGQMLGGIVRTAAEFERFEATLTATEGSADKAKTALAWASKFAAETPLQLDQVIDAFIRARAYGLDPMNGSLKAMVDTMAATGRGSEMLGDVVNSLGQAWSKGKLQSEDAQELLTRGIPVFATLAQVMGKSEAQLQKMASAGKLGRKEIALLIDALGKRNAGAAARMMTTWDGLISNLQDQWTRFQLMMSRAGLFDWMKQQISGLLAVVDRMAADGSLQKLAAEWGGRFKDALVAVKDAALIVNDVLVAVHDRFNSWKPALAAVAAVMAGPLVLALGSAALAIGKLGLALALTPFGWAIGLAAALAAAAIGIYTNWEWVAGRLQAIWAGLTAAVQPVINAVNETAGLIGRATTATGDFLRGYAKPAAAQPTAVPPGAASASALSGDISVSFANAPAGTRLTGMTASPRLTLSASMGRNFDPW
jgi:tape measure domain-containing protein